MRTHWIVCPALFIIASSAAIGCRPPRFYEYEFTGRLLWSDNRPVARVMVFYADWKLPEEEEVHVPERLARLKGLGYNLQMTDAAGIFQGQSAGGEQPPGWFPPPAPELSRVVLWVDWGEGYKQFTVLLSHEMQSKVDGARRYVYLPPVILPRSPSARSG